MTEHTERKSDRRKGQAQFYNAIADRRRPSYERRVGATVAAQPGEIRPGPGERLHFGERRRYLDGGME
jgi:hypothetical protein